MNNSIIKSNKEIKNWFKYEHTLFEQWFMGKITKEELDIKLKKYNDNKHRK